MITRAHRFARPFARTTRKLTEEVNMNELERHCHWLRHHAAALRNVVSAVQPGTISELDLIAALRDIAEALRLIEAMVKRDRKEAA